MPSTDSIQRFLHRLDEETRIGRDSTPGRLEISLLAEQMFGLLFPDAHCEDKAGPGFAKTSQLQDCETSRLNGVIHVYKDDAFQFTKRIVAEEGIFCGVSTGATLAAISQKLSGVPANATVQGFNYDAGERYLSVKGLFD